MVTLSIEKMARLSIADLYAILQVYERLEPTTRQLEDRKIEYDDSNVHMNFEDRVDDIELVQYQIRQRIKELRRD